MNKNRVKRILAAPLAALTLLSLAACGGSTAAADDETGDAAVQQTEEQKKTDTAKADTKKADSTKSDTPQKDASKAEDAKKDSTKQEDVKQDPPKQGIVPADGTILSTTTVTFSEGESVFDVLQRVCRDNGIHMEYSWTPMYNSAYVEGIANLYEFDVGSLSGWMYKVNGWFPNYGCSRYQLKDGDTVCWVYTCDLGYDVGGGYAVGG